MADRKSLADTLRGARHLWLIAALLLLMVAILALWPSGGGYRSTDADQTALEARLEHVLAAVEGAGRVSVMIHEAPAAKDVFLADENDNESIMGVLVVASGADDLGVRIRLYTAVETLLGVAPEQIVVTSMGGEK